MWLLSRIPTFKFQPTIFKEIPLPQYENAPIILICSAPTYAAFLCYDLLRIHAQRSQMQRPKGDSHANGAYVIFIPWRLES